MQITVNGESRQISDGLTVLELLEQLQVEVSATVVMRNDDIVEQPEFDRTTLNEGDLLELVRLVGGG